MIVKALLPAATEMAKIQTLLEINLTVKKKKIKLLHLITSQVSQE